MNCSHAASSCGEVLVLVAQVVIGRDQIGLRDLHRRLRAALALRIRRLAGRDRQPVMTGDLDDRRVADRDPAHVLDRHRLLVIGQRVGRDAIEPPQRPVQPDHHRRQRLVAQRHHHPIPRPRQPRAEQHRPGAGDHRPVAIVPLQPQPRLRDPRPRPPPVLLAPPALGLRDRPPGRALRPLIPHRDQLRVRLISADPPARAIDQLLDLRRERVDQRPPPLARSGSPPPAASRAATSRATVL